MIKNFDVIKEQLKELAGVINSFKSEAVQLRLIELVFEAAEGGSDEESSRDTPRRESRRRKARRPASKLPPTAANPKAKGSGSGRLGGKAMLDRLHGAGFFKKPKTIKQLVEHCENNLAIKYKQSAFSGPLGRLTRDGKLKRTKNADKQYEYSEA